MRLDIWPASLGWAHAGAATRSTTAPSGPSRTLGSAEAASPPQGADAAIREALLRHLGTHPGWDSPRSNVHVADGRVVLQGVLGAGHVKGVTARLARSVPGVTEVWDARVPRREWQGMA